MGQASAEFFELKADLVPLTVIKLLQIDLVGIQNQITQTIKKAPNYFHQAPVVVDLSRVQKQADLDFQNLVGILRRHNIIVVALRGATPELASVALAMGLVTLKSSVDKTTGPDESDKNKSPTKIITKPIRAGTQVYAKGGDLIILAAVNPGAECFADGSIHVYGPLRGRALAGVNGDRLARIFCKVLDAELVAIAGHYQIKENIKSPIVGDGVGMIQIFLDNEKLHMSTI